MENISDLFLIKNSHMQWVKSSMNVTKHLKPKGVIIRDGLQISEWTKAKGNATCLLTSVFLTDSTQWEKDNLDKLDTNFWRIRPGCPNWACMVSGDVAVEHAFGEADR